MQNCFNRTKQFIYMNTTNKSIKILFKLGFKLNKKMNGHLINKKNNKYFNAIFVKKNV